MKLLNGFIKKKPMIGGNVTEIKITPETYEDMNKEFEEEDIPFRIVIPTQEEIDKWQSQPAPPYQTPPAVDMVAEMWEDYNAKKKLEDNQK